MQLQGKTILITGGGSGIGLALCQELHAKGNTLVVCGREASKLQALKTQLPAVHVMPCDLTRHEDIEGLFTRLRAEGLQLDVLINNAGVIEIWQVGKQQLDEELIIQKLVTNLLAPVLLSQRFIRQADGQKSNLIVNITSEAALMPVPLLPLYSASKAGLRVFTQCLRVQLQGTGFRVVEVLPPAVETKMTTQNLKNTTRLLEPAQFARQVIQAIESGKTEYAPGSNAFLMHLLDRLAPALGIRLIHFLSKKQLQVS